MAGDGPQGISSFMMRCGGEKKTLKSRIFRGAFFSAAVGVTALPEMPKGHQKAPLQTARHGDTVAGKEALCRGDNSHRTSAGTQWRSD